MRYPCSRSHYVLCWAATIVLFALISHLRSIALTSRTHIILLFRQSNSIHSKFSNKDANFLNLQWSKLPLKARKAAETLGWTEEQWNTEKWSEIEEYWYEDLSAEQKAAATELGWDAAAWDEKYEDHDWSDLPAVAQKAAKALGFTQEMWDDDEWPEELEEAEWEDLGGDKKKALQVLGYNRWDWE